MKSIIREDDTSSKSNKENTQSQFYFSQVLDLPTSSKSSQSRSYLEELHDNGYFNELENIINIEESSNAPNNVKTSSINVQNGNNNNRKTNINIDKNDSKKSRRWIWAS